MKRKVAASKSVRKRVKKLQEFPFLDLPEHIQLIVVSKMNAKTLCAMYRAHPILFGEKHCDHWRDEFCRRQVKRSIRGSLGRLVVCIDAKLCVGCFRSTRHVNWFFNLPCCQSCERALPQFKTITKGRALGEFKVPKQALDELPHLKVDNPHFKCARPMTLFLLNDVAEYSLQHATTDQ